MKAEKQSKEEERGGDKGSNEKAAAATAAALMTQLATALVCSAQPCHGKLSSLSRSALLATNLQLLSR